MKGKSDKPFDASLAFDAQFNITFVFPDKGVRNSGKKKK